MIVPFAEWAPDAADLGASAREAMGLIPEKEGYRPFKSLATTSSALTARAQGAVWFRKPNGSTINFAGDTTKLYYLNSSTWTDCSRTVGGAYATDATGNWRFAQFKDSAYATNFADDVQSFDLSSGTNWAAASGSPPKAAFIGVVGNFLVLAYTAASPQEVAWSGDNNAGTWATSATTLADSQVLPDSGAITGFASGAAGVVFQESALRRMQFEGSPTVFRFDKIASDLGATIPNSVASWGGLSFFCHRSGFHMVQNAQTVVPFGRDRFDRWFWGLVDQTNLHRCSSAIDPVNSLYMLSFPTGSSGTPAEILIYNWKADKAAHVPVTCEMIYSGATQQSWTLEDLDAFGTIEAVPFSLDSSYWTGIRQLLLAGFYTDHKSGTFSGVNAATQIDTQEVQLIPGRRARLSRSRPLIDGGSPQLAVGTRGAPQGTVVWTGARSTVGDGSVPLNAEGRYHRWRATMAAGSTFQWQQGIEVDPARDFFPGGLR